MIRRDTLESPWWKYFHEFTNKSAQVRAISEGFCNMHRTISCNGEPIEIQHRTISWIMDRVWYQTDALPAARSTFSATSSRRSTINNYQAIVQVAGWNFETQLERERKRERDHRADFASIPANCDFCRFHVRFGLVRLNSTLYRA